MLEVKLSFPGLKYVQLANFLKYVGKIFVTIIKCIFSMYPSYPGPGLSDGVPLLGVGDGAGHNHQEEGRVAGGRAH